MKKILIAGGNGKIAREFTSFAVNRNWEVYSLIREQKQEQSLRDLGSNPIVFDLAKNSLADYEKLVAEVSPEYGIFLAGANTSGKFTEIDRDADIKFAQALSANGVKYFINISTLGAGGQKELAAIAEPYRSSPSFLDYLKAKTAADEFITKVKNLDWIIIRPGALTDTEDVKNFGVTLSPNIPVKDKYIPRKVVAELLVALVENPDFIKNSIEYLTAGNKDITSIFGQKR